MNAFKTSLGFLFVFLACVISAFGQTQPNLDNGYRAYGSYDGSNVDTVNLQNGNLMLHIPMPFSYPQRGDKLTSTNVLSVSSKAWSVQMTPPNSAGQTQQYWSMGGFGPTVNIGKIGTGIGFANTMDLAVHRTLTHETDSFGGSTYTSGYYLTTWDGSTHQLVEQPNGPLDANGDPQFYDAEDLSGYRVELGQGCTALGETGCGVVIDRSGNRYEFDHYATHCSKPTTNNNLNGNTTTMVCQQASFTSRIIDVNGNLINTQDTMGRLRNGSTTVLGGDTSGCVAPAFNIPIASATTSTYQGFNGVTNQIKVCTANIPIQTFFGQPGVFEYQNSSEALGSNGITSLAMVVTVLILDGDTWTDSSRWTFSYDSYGNVTSVGLPTGGSITYGWATLNGGSGCGGATKMTRVVSSRTINDNNGNSFLWNYSFGVPTLGGTFFNTVTDPLGNDIRHAFSGLDGGCHYYETTTQYFQGSSSSGGSLLKQVDTTYQKPASAIGTPGVAAAYVPATIRTTLSNGRVGQVTRSYDLGPGNGRPINGNIIMEKAYDWGQGAPGPLMREIDTTYQWQADSTGAYETAHLIDIQSSSIVKDAGGCTASETDYAYDEGGESALQPSGIGTAQQHVVPHTPGVRGNSTSVTKWLITGASPGTCGAKTSSVTSKAIFYDTGLVYQSVDPLNHGTTYSYDPVYAGAYTTKTCDVLNRCVSGTYDFTSGLLTSFTNQNGTQTASGNTPGDAAHTAAYGYDAMSRITLAIFPDGGQVSFNYSSPNTFPISAEKVKKTSATLDDHSFAYLDGLGRSFKAVHRTPAGDATVYTTFDALNRAISATNPYISTSEPTYGAVQSQYDALGRTTQVTKQDGGLSTILYNQAGSVSAGDCTTATDEAGKQRRTCTDGLGRMVEVNEPGDSFPGSKAGGSLTVGGNLSTKTIPGTNAIASTATITVNGNEHHIIVTSPPPKCTVTQMRAGNCDQTPTSSDVYDAGTVSIAINGGSPYISNFGGGSSSSTIASDLVNKINNLSPNPYVSASVTNTTPTSATITLTARNAGTAGNNISFSTSTTWDTIDFPPPNNTSSFVPGPGSGTLGGGTDGTAPTTVTDSGTIKGIVTSPSGATIFTTAPVSYGGTSGNNSAMQLATALSAALNATGSPVSASANGTTISLTYKTIGTAGNITLSLSSTSSQATYFPNGSFSGSGSLGNGADPEGPSLDHPYVTQYAYDALGNMTCAVQKGSDVTPFTTCAAAPATWRPRSFTYDSLSRLLTATNPESGTITYSYDIAGNLLQKISPAANQTGAATTTISVCYDELNRPTGKSYSAQNCQNGHLPLGTAAITFTYDAGTNGLGYLTSLTDQAGSASFSYDALGRVTAEQRTTSGISKSVSYDYNLDGSLSVIHYPSGAAIAYTPDSAGRTLSVTDAVNGINYVTGAVYAPNNALTSFTSGNNAGFAGIASAFSYNPRLQPVNISATTPGQQKVFSVGYDFHLGNASGSGDNGNVWGITNFKDPSRSETFTYDALNRLTSGQTAGTDCGALLADGHTKNWGDSYSYDPWGNLLGKTSTKCGGENVALTMNTKNQPLYYSFDAAGNLTNDGVFTYNYDTENRLTGANGYTYTYDADGNRVKKSNGTVGTLYWYSAVGVIAETDLAGNNQHEYIFFNGTRVARKDSNGQIFYYFSDWLKTTSVITDSTGNVKSESDYDPWGVERRVVDSFNNTYKFTGKEEDAETGLDNFGARYYASAMGRFMTPDWAAKAVAVPYANYGNPQSLNLYSYVQNNPTTLGDPDGHQQKENEKQNVAPQASNPGPKTEKWTKDGEIRHADGSVTVTFTSDTGEKASVTLHNNGLSTLFKDKPCEVNTSSTSMSATHRGEIVSYSETVHYVAGVIYPQATNGLNGPTALADACGGSGEAEHPHGEQGNEVYTPTNPVKNNEQVINLNEPINGSQGQVGSGYSGISAISVNANQPAAVLSCADRLYAMPSNHPYVSGPGPDVWSNPRMPAPAGYHTQPNR